jgi:hypothetical protein
MESTGAGFRSKYFWLFGILGIGCLVAGWVNGGLTWAFFGWCALASFGVCVAYGIAGPKLFGKRADGSLSPVPLVLLLPYFALTRLLRWLKAITAHSPHSHEILSGLWLGAWPESEQRLPAGCALVIDLTAEFPVARGVKAGVERVLCLPTLDTDAPTQEHLQEALMAMGAVSKPVYVHCAAGVGRSATVVGAYLLQRETVATVDDAEAFLRRMRPGVRFTKPQRRLLSKLFGQGEAGA